jgi:hypothetical protein
MAYTSCALTTGFDLDCRDAVGGVKSVSFANLADYIALSPVVTAGAITSITATATFYKYEQLKETSSMTETINGSSQNGTVYYTPEVVVVLSKLDVNKRNEIKLLAQQRLVAIVETNDGSYWIVGYENGLELNAGTSATGTAFADLSGFSLTLSGLESKPMVSISAIFAHSRLRVLFHSSVGLTLASRGGFSF